MKQIEFIPNFLIISVLPNIIIIARTLAHPEDIEIIKVYKCRHKHGLNSETTIQNKEEEKIFLCFSNSEKGKMQKLKEKSFCCFRFGRKQLEAKKRTTEQETKENIFGLFDYKKETQTKRKYFWVFK